MAKRTKRWTVSLAAPGSSPLGNCFFFSSGGWVHPCHKNWEGGLPLCLSEGTLGHRSQGTWFKEALAFNRHCDKPLRGNNSQLLRHPYIILRIPLLVFCTFTGQTILRVNLSNICWCFSEPRNRFDANNATFRSTWLNPHRMQLSFENQCAKSHPSCLRYCSLLWVISVLQWDQSWPTRPVIHVLSCLVLLDVSANSSSLCQTCRDITYKKALW